MNRENAALSTDLDDPSVVPDKPVIAGIRVDPAEEIMANKLCTLLARAEVRDLVDLRALEGWRSPDARTDQAFAPKPAPFGSPPPLG